MSDLVERLRGYPGASLEQLMGDVYQRSYAGLSKEAADEIERLQKAYRPADMIEYQELVAEIERLRAALERIVAEGSDPDPIGSWYSNAKDLAKIAREALK